VSAFAIGLSAAPAAATHEPVLDANCPGPPNDSVSMAANHRRGQTFTAQTTGILVRAEIEVTKPASTTGDWVMEIWATDPMGAPTNALLGSATIADATVPTGDVRLVGTFSPGVGVAAGQSYVLSLRRAAAWNLRDRNSNPCPGNEFFSAGPTSTWSVPSTFDLVFAVFVGQPDPPEPDPEPGPKADGTLTIDANKGKVEKGRKVTLSGQYDTPTNEACEPNRQIQIQRRLKSQPDSAFATFETVQTDAAGNYTLKTKVKKTRFYRAVVTETDACDDETSNSQKVRVQKKKAAQEA
jgi:hypothetical protein